MNKNIILQTIKDYKNSSNKDLEHVLKTLSFEFEETKKLVIKLTHHLDNIESNYNIILKEYKKRIGNE